MNTLEIDRITDPGIFLIAGDEEVVLLPNIYVTPEMAVGKYLEVFVYSDSEDRIVATTLTPAGVVGDFVALEVVDTMLYGAFMNWGLAKDLLIPSKFQKTIYNIGEIKVVKIIEDVETDRLFGTEKFGELLTGDVSELKRNQEVKLMTYHKTPLGYKVLIADNDEGFRFEGMIFHNEIFQHLKIGQKLTGYVKNMRSDRKIDISLQPLGKKAEKIGSARVLEVLGKNSGKIDFTYKSSSENISDIFGISKKAFKKALTELIEKKRIKLNEDSIEIIKQRGVFSHL